MDLVWLKMDQNLNNFHCFTFQYKSLATEQKYTEKLGGANIWLLWLNTTRIRKATETKADCLKIFYAVNLK